MDKAKARQIARALAAATVRANLKAQIYHNALTLNGNSAADADLIESQMVEVLWLLEGRGQQPQEMAWHTDGHLPIWFEVLRRNGDERLPDVMHIVTRGATESFCGFESVGLPAMVEDRFFQIKSYGAQPCRICATRAGIKIDRNSSEEE